MMDAISTCDELGCLNRWQEKWKSMTVPTDRHPQVKGVFYSTGEMQNCIQDG
jgi:hypothetical protein